MTRFTACSTSSNEVYSLRPGRSGTKKGAFFFASLLFLCVSFSFCFVTEAFPVLSVVNTRFEAAYECDLDCGIDGTCVPDFPPTFRTLLAHRHSGSMPFRCLQHKEEAVTTTTHTNVVDEDDDTDDFFPEDFLLTSNGCPYECQNGGTCVSIFGGLSFACICQEPFWGTECELDGSTEPCELDCSSIVADASQLKEGAFCVESPENPATEVEDQTCVHCEEISEEEKPNCNELIDCKNGGVCNIEYQFIIAAASGDQEANSSRPFKCSSTTAMAVTGFDGSTTMETHWTDLPAYKLTCNCQLGFQGETCEEIDVCGMGCQNNGYCISKDTPGDGSDDFFNFNTDDSNNNDDMKDPIHDDDFFLAFDDDDDDDDYLNMDDVSFDDDDDIFLPPVSGKVDCICYEGHCDQTSCASGATCVGGMCIQDGLVSPMCSGGKCSQRHAHHPSCTGGDCDQTAAVEATCGGTDCFRDEIEAQTIVPDTGTMPPDFQPFCSCEYGYFGDLCQHEITTICLLDESGYNKLLHQVCLRLGGLCPLDIGNRFCTNGGSCGNITSNIFSNDFGTNDSFNCDCPDGYEGVHCEIEITNSPTPEPSTTEPIAIEQVSSSPPLTFASKFVWWPMVSSIGILFFH